ncbi:hypothetical protein M3J09_009199 [Ascochyta lentis]
MDAVHEEEEIFVTEIFLVEIPENHVPVKVSAKWKVSEPTTRPDATRYFRSIDLLLRLMPAVTDHVDVDNVQINPDASESALGTFVRHIWPLGYSSVNRTDVVVKVVLATCGGYVCRSDILKIRMQHSQYVDTVIPFSAWDECLPVLTCNKKKALLPLLLSSAGALLVKRSQLPDSETLELLQHDLHLRLSFDWILRIKPTARRVAVVGGRPMPDPKSGLYGSSVFFEAAQALGVSLVVFDAPGHWLQDQRYAYLREDFIAMDMSDLEELPLKLAQAVRSRRPGIDGIVTFMDEYVGPTSQAAELLGLPTEDAHNMVRAHYKHEMRQIIHDANIEVVFLENPQQLDDPAFSVTLKALRYPMVVKPCRGGTSKGIKKVADEISLRQAVRMIDEDEDDLAKHGILLETYVSGPEFDANFVLSDGRVLFLEVTDNFPCLADASGATLADNFAETVQVSNTGLPEKEAETIRSSIHGSLLKLGFKSGVFHCEGRMMHSSMRYGQVNDNGILDLINSDSAIPGQTPEVFLLEVNARPPGTGGTWATLYTYGVDLGALQLLRALGDSKRSEALSVPFAYPDSNPGSGGGAQWWTAHCMVPIHRNNVRIPENLFHKLYEALPEIVPYVTRAEMYATPGTVVSPTAGIGWIAYLLLGSRISRAHTLHMYHQIAGASKKILDASNYDSGYES